MAHAGCGIMFLLYMEKNRPDMDDRWVKALSPKSVAPLGRSLLPGVDEALQLVADARAAK
jgi:hypothetical protein